MRGLLRVLLFVVAGPIIGLLAFAVLVGLFTLATRGSTRDFALGLELFAPALLIAAYTVGGIPALLTGIGAIFIARWKYGWKSWLVTALLGGFVCLVRALSLFGAPRLTGANDNSGLTLLLTLTGAVAGFACATLFEGLAALADRRAA